MYQKKDYPQLKCATQNHCSKISNKKREEKRGEKSQKRGSKSSFSRHTVKRQRKKISLIFSSTIIYNFDHVCTKFTACGTIVFSNFTRENTFFLSFMRSSFFSSFTAASKRFEKYGKNVTGFSWRLDSSFPKGCVFVALCVAFIVTKKTLVKILSFVFFFLSRTRIYASMRLLGSNYTTEIRDECGNWGKGVGETNEFVSQALVISYKLSCGRISVR